MVSELENISMNEVWELPVYQFLNDLVYIKERNRYEAEILRKEQMKYKK